jgi:hypothetical protein
LTSRFVLPVVKVDHKGTGEGRARKSNLSVSVTSKDEDEIINCRFILGRVHAGCRFFVDIVLIVATRPLTVGRKKKTWYLLRPQNPACKYLHYGKYLLCCVLQGGKGNGCGMVSMY